MALAPLTSAERRSRRSNETLTALTYQLEHSLMNENLRNISLGDSSGQGIAQAGDAFESEVLAAYAPLLSRSVNQRFRLQIFRRMEPLMPGVTLENIYVRQFDVDGETLFLTFCGDPGVARDVSLYRTITGVRRILSQD